MEALAQPKPVKASKNTMRQNHNWGLAHLCLASSLASPTVFTELLRPDAQPYTNSSVISPIP